MNQAHTNVPKSLWKPLADPTFVLPLRAFVREHVTPAGDAIDRDDVYPAELMKLLARQGFSAITLPTRYGGGERDFSCAVALFEEVAVGSAAVGVSLLTNFLRLTLTRKPSRSNADTAFNAPRHSVIRS